MIVLIKMADTELYARLQHLRDMRHYAMQRRASIMCGDALFDESPEYLKMEEQLCASRMASIEAELRARSLPVSPQSSSQPPTSPWATPGLDVPSPHAGPSRPAPPLALAATTAHTSPHAAAQTPPSPRRSASSHGSLAGRGGATVGDDPPLAAEPAITADDLPDWDAWDLDDDDVVEVPPPSRPSPRPAPEAASQSSSRSPRAPHAWDAQVEHALRRIFHMASFRPDQREAIDATLSGRDVFCLMPTGGGKSLCYQLPATVTAGATDGLTVVVSPLLALIHNQVQALLAKNIPTIAITGDMDEEKRRFATSELYKRDMMVRLLYVTPEFIANSRTATNLFQHLYQQHKLARFVIDEAHCVDQWGHDFRPDYVRLDMLRKTYPTVPLMALTATARIDTVADIQRHLGMRSALVLRQSFNRPNLTYAVRVKKRGSGTLEQMAALIQQHHANECGIIYCLSRRDCENVACDLNAKFGIRARHFHAGLNTQDKLRIQESWQAGQFKVIVATIAFGMGIDKADVRFVLHHSMPKSLEGYYQETGRAGRDGQRAECVLFWSMDDSRKLENMIKDSADASPAQKQLQLTSLKQVTAFCQSLTECRRTNILKYFGETFDKTQCHGTCDNCARAPVHSVDLTTPAQDLVKMVQQLAPAMSQPPQQHVTKAHCMAVFRGSLRKDIKDRGHHLNLYHGRGASLSEDDVQRLVNHLLQEHVLCEYAKKAAYQRFPNHYLKAGDAAPALLQGRRRILLDMPTTQRGAAPPRRSAPRAASPPSDDMDLALVSMSPPSKRRGARPALGDVTARATNARSAGPAPKASAPRRAMAAMPMPTRR